MAAAVRPTVAISICRVLMMESAVMIGFRALDARALELGTGVGGSRARGVMLTLLSREAAP